MYLLTPKKLFVGFWFVCFFVFRFCFFGGRVSQYHRQALNSRLSLNTGIRRQELPSVKHPVSNSYLAFLNQVLTDMNLESSKVSCNDYTSVRRNISI